MVGALLSFSTLVVPLRFHACSGDRSGGLGVLRRLDIFVLLGDLIIVCGVLWNLRTGAARPH